MSAPEGSTQGEDAQLPSMSDDGAEASGGAPRAEDLGEDDLFGSEDDAAGAPPASGAAPGGGEAAEAATGAATTAAAAGAPAAAGGAAAGAVDDLGDIEDDLNEKELFGSEDDDGGPQVDEKDLFGDEDEAQPAEPAQIEPPEPSEMDEREIFGDVSEDEEPEKVEDVTLMRRPQPGDDRVFMSLRLPNVLSVEKRCFRPGSIPQHLLNGYREFQNTRGQTEVKLLTAENCIRWRFKRSADGDLVYDDLGRPQYESNARIVEWEDGSKTLFVGKEVFNLSQIADRAHVFEENSQDIHVCHGSVKTRLIATPQSLSSATHESLKRSQYKKFEPPRRSLLMSQEEVDMERGQQKQLDELEMFARKQEQARLKRSAGKADIDPEFLEDGAAVGPSIAAEKRAFKEGAKRLRSE